MKNRLITLTLLLFSQISLSQVYGDLFMDKRKIVKDIEYTVNHSKPGKVVFDILVDVDGNVTSCKLNEEKSTITASSATIQAKNKIIQHLKFEFGLQYPKFHKGYVQIKTVKGKTKQDKRFLPPTD